MLIVRLSAIGDVVHALPLASALKDAYPHLEITWLVEEIPADIVLGNPDLHEVIVVPRSRWKQGRLSSPRVWREYIEFLSSIRRRRFDLTIDLQGYAKSALFALAAGARHRLGWWKLRDGANFVSRALPRRPGSVHRVDWFLDVARALGIDMPTVRFPLDIPRQVREAVQDKLARGGIEPGTHYVVINQAAGNPPRRWGRDRFGAVALCLAEQHGLPTVLIGTAPKSSDCEAIVRQVRNGMEAEGIKNVPPPINLAGATTLKELTAVLDGSLLHITGDTGSTHIAAALGIPVMAFYGSTDPAHAGPWGQMQNVLARRELCSPSCTVRQCAFAVANGETPPASTTRREFLDGGSGSQETAVPLARCLASITVEEATAKLDLILRAARLTKVRS